MFVPSQTNTALEGLADEVHITGRQEPGSKRTRRRLQRYRTGIEGRISHLKRSYGLTRSRLKGDEGHQIWDGMGRPSPTTPTPTPPSREANHPPPSRNG